jgi:hypothetical protein
MTSKKKNTLQQRSWLERYTSSKVAGCGIAQKILFDGITRFQQSTRSLGSKTWKKELLKKRRTSI